MAADHARALLSGAPPPGISSAAGPPQRGYRAGDPGAARAPASGDRDLRGFLTPPQPSTMERMRAEGTSQLEGTLRAVVRRADQIDGYWARFLSVCLGEYRPSGGYDRDWFGIWDSRVPLGDARPACRAWAADLKAVTSELRATMADAEEAARRADVFPGVRRDLRRKYRLDWPGWDR